MARKASKIIEVNSQQMQELLDRAASNALRPEDTELMRQIFDSYAHLFEIVGDKNTTIAKLRKLLFGASSEKTDKVVGNTKESAMSRMTSGDDNASDKHAAPNDSAATDEEPRPGHGRYGADDYPGADQVDVPHPTLCAGDDCPECQDGTLYEKEPSVFVRFVGQAPLQATVYRMQRLRCHLCGKVFTAPAPDGVGDEKYDHTVASMIGLLKYGSGFPFNRQQRLQGNCEIPLAASTQWEIVYAAALLLARGLRGTHPASRSRRSRLQRRYDGQDSGTDGPAFPEVTATRRPARSRPHGAVHLGRGGHARRPADRALFQWPPARGRELDGGLEASRGGTRRADPDVRWTGAESPQGTRDDSGELPGSWPTQLRGSV